jgi:hypothetical protein
MNATTTMLQMIPVQAKPALPGLFPMKPRTMEMPAQIRETGQVKKEANPPVAGPRQQLPATIVISAMMPKTIDVMAMPLTPGCSFTFLRRLRTSRSLSSSSSSRSRRRLLGGFGSSSSSSSSTEEARFFLMGGGFDPDDDGLAEIDSDSTSFSGSGSAAGGGGIGFDETADASGAPLDGAFSDSGTRINVAHFGHLTRFPAALSGTRILLLQPVHSINIALPRDWGVLAEKGVPWRWKAIGYKSEPSLSNSRVADFTACGLALTWHRATA